MNHQMKGVIGFGETVVDFLPKGFDRNNPVYEACPGGSVANLTAAVSALGLKSAFIGGVGDDFFGHFLVNRIHSYGVDTSQVIYKKDFGTSLVFVHYLENDQRGYSYANRPSAEQMIKISDIDFTKISQFAVLHVSSNVHYTGCSKATQKAMLKMAKECGMVVSYDLNYRPNNHTSLDRAKEDLCDAVGYADIIKATEEELVMLIGKSGRDAAELLFDKGAKIILETLGSEGVAYYLPDGSGHVRPDPVEVVDSTGAGDWFLAGFLTEMLRLGDLKTYTENDVRKACIYGNRAAGFSIMQSGAMIDLPDNFSL